MASSVTVQIDRFAFHPLMQTAAMEQVLREAAERLRSAAGSEYEVITSNQKRRTRSVIAVGRTDDQGLRQEVTSGTLARALSSLEQPWTR